MEVANTSHLLRAPSNFIQVYNVRVMDVAILSLRYTKPRETFAAHVGRQALNLISLLYLVKNIDP
jgi:hypothetical protein